MAYISGRIERCATPKIFRAANRTHFLGLCRVARFLQKCASDSYSFKGMDEIHVLKVPQRYAQLYKQRLLADGILDPRHCLQKHPSGTVALPLSPSALSLDLPSLQSRVAQGSSCEILKIQAPGLKKKKEQPKSHRERIIEAVQVLVVNCGETWTQELEDDLPKAWQRHGDLVLLGEGCFSHNIWRETGSDLWLAVACALGVNRLAQIKQISRDGFRTPVVTMLLGESSSVTHIDNHIRYDFDVTKCMFSFGNITEKLRIASFSCTGETVVDLYAGIGYFTLPYLVHAGASHVHACEWNPDAVAALVRNLQLNKVADRCTVHQGDNKQLSLRNVADRVNLGLIPSSEEGWPVACRLLRKDVGGILHIHHNVAAPVHRQKLDQASDSQGIASVEDGEVVDEPLTRLREREVWNAWAKATASRFVTLFREITGDAWRTTIKHIERVKSYAPHISHIVLDLECRPVT